MNRSPIWLPSGSCKTVSSSGYGNVSVAAIMCTPRLRGGGRVMVAAGRFGPEFPSNCEVHIIIMLPGTRAGGRWAGIGETSKPAL